jgi:UDP-N-acetylmuramoyl-L-alanyl-D-glutamate--2,6-diaminopimelate ligase
MTNPSLAVLLNGFESDQSVADIVPTGITLNSEHVQKGYLFVALSGKKRNGMAFIKDAAERGACAVIFDAAQKLEYSPIPAIAVPQLRSKMGFIADRFFASPSRAMQVIGVTGTNGKTSVVQLLAQTLHSQGCRSASIGTLGVGVYGHLKPNCRTTPDVFSVHQALADFHREHVNYAAMEVSSHALDQGRVDQVAFNIALFTNLTRDHLDYHETMDHYFSAKSKLFLDFDLDCAVINQDDHFGARLLKMPMRAKRIIRYSALGDTSCDIYATEISANRSGVAFVIHRGADSAFIQTQLMGYFNVANLLAVAACLSSLDWPLLRIQAALEKLMPVVGRMNRISDDHNCPLVVIDYAHTPDALEKALVGMRAHVRDRLICVFGCGGNRDAGKRPMMGKVAEQFADLVILTDDNARDESPESIVMAIKQGMQHPENARVEHDRSRAIQLAVSLASANDGVLVAGKGHETDQEFAGSIRYFDDSAEALKALRACA